MLPPLPPEEIARREERQAKRDRAERKARRDPYTRVTDAVSPPTHHPARSPHRPKSSQRRNRPAPKKAKPTSAYSPATKQRRPRKPTRKGTGPHERKQARNAPPQPTAKPEPVTDQVVKTQPAPVDPNPPGTPTGPELVALALAHGITRDLHRAAQQIRAPWYCHQWSAAHRNTIAQMLTSMIEAKNAKPKKGQPK